MKKINITPKFMLKSALVLGAFALMYFHPFAGMASMAAVGVVTEDEDDDVLTEVKKVAKQVKGYEKALGDKISKEELEEVNNAVKALTAGFKTMDDAKIIESITTIKTTTDKFQTQLEEMKEVTDMLKDSRNKRESRKSFGAQVVEAFKAAKHLDSPLKKGEWRSIELKDFNTASLVTNKVVANMTTANVDAVGENSIPYELADFEKGLTRIQRRTPWILQIANTSPIAKMYAQWAEQANVDGTVVPKGEGVAKPQIDFDWVEKSAKVEKYPAFIKISTEMLDDLDGIQNEIDMELTERINLAVDADLLSGNGATPILNGILNQDTAFTGSVGGVVITTTNATRSDVLRAAIAQVVGNLFMPNYILLNPADVAFMDLEKDLQGRYQIAPFKSANGMNISGVTVLENMGQTAGNFTVGDFNKLNVRIRKGMQIDMGLDADDFTKNLITIRGEMRLVSYIKANHAGAFVSGDFATAIGLITLVP